MPSNREKGLAFQREIKKFLEGRDWIVHNCTIGSRWQKNRDIFGADLIARQWDTVFGVTRLLWIQATLDSHLQRKVDGFKKYFKDTMRGEELHIWMKTKGNEIKIKRVIILFREISIQDYGKIIKGKFYPSGRPNHVL